MDEKKAGRPTLYPGKPKRPSYTLTEDAVVRVRISAEQAECTQSDFVQTLIERHSGETVRYLQEQKGKRDAEQGTTGSGPDAPGGIGGGGVAAPDRVPGDS